MPIRIVTNKSVGVQIKSSFKKNRIHYLQEALGLAIFMISACFFGALLEAQHSSIHHSIPNDFLRTIFMGVLMGATALFIFYSRFTAPSGAQINPAVTLTFWRLGKMCPWDSLFFIIFQFIGGTIAVIVMRYLMGGLLTEPPVQSVVTVPGKFGIVPAIIIEFLIAFITMMMVLFTSNDPKFKKYTRVIAACMVCSWVIVAGPVSGFGMNPARSFATAFSANIWTSFWIYLFVPIAGMMSAAEFFLLFTKRVKNRNLLEKIAES
ncbi:MAG: aquaporin [Chitinophagaceae bacterium]